MNTITLATPEQDCRDALSTVEPFDYTQLDPDVADIVRERTESIRIHELRMKEAAAAIGDDLLAVKETLKHGQWLAWLAGEFSMSERSAQGLMQIARAFKSAISADLALLKRSVLGVLAEGAVPEAARIEALERARSGKRIDIKAARAIVVRHRNGSTPARHRNGQPPPAADKPVTDDGEELVEPAEPAPPTVDDRPRRPDWALAVDFVFVQAERAVAVPPADVAAYLDPEREPDPNEYSREERREQHRQKIGALRAWLDAVEVALMGRGREGGSR